MQVNHCAGVKQNSLLGLGNHQVGTIFSHHRNQTNHAFCASMTKVKNPWHSGVLNFCVVKRETLNRVMPPNVLKLVSSNSSRNQHQLPLRSHRSVRKPRFALKLTELCVPFVCRWVVHVVISEWKCLRFMASFLLVPLNVPNLFE